MHHPLNLINIVFFLFLTQNHIVGKIEKLTSSTPDLLCLLFSGKHISPFSKSSLFIPESVINQFSGTKWWVNIFSYLNNKKKIVKEKKVEKTENILSCHCVESSSHISFLILVWGCMASICLRASHNKLPFWKKSFMQKTFLLNLISIHWIFQKIHFKKDCLTVATLSKMSCFPSWKTQWN